MERITANVGKVCRPGSCLRAPVTMLVSGVLNGSKGRLFYPPDELEKTAADWEGMPIVVNHPMVNGVHVSARDPSAQRYTVGTVFNAKFRNGKLTAEGWFDPDKLRKVNPFLLSAIESGRKMELSTGLFTDNVPAPRGATHNGRSYDFVARNYRPDHLAILTSEVGACSVNDGCGVHVNNYLSQGTEMNDRDDYLPLPTMDFNTNVTANCGCGKQGNNPFADTDAAEENRQRLALNADCLSRPGLNAIYEESPTSNNSYLGAAGVAPHLTLNEDERDDILPLPTINWNEESSAATEDDDDALPLPRMQF